MPNGAARRPRLNIPILVIAVILFLLFVSLSTIVAFYVNWLWFGEVGFLGVFWKEILTKWVIGLVFGAIFFVFLYFNIWLARRFAPVYPPVEVIEGTIPFPGRRQQMSMEELVQQIRNTIEPFVKWILIGLALLIAIGQGAAAGANWLSYLRFANQVPFGQADPLFGRDIGFYFFTFPLYQWVYEWLFSAVIITTIVTALVHVYDGAIRFVPGAQRFAPHVKGHLSVLLGLLVLVKAWGYNLDMYNLLYSPRGRVIGASYTDVHAQLPALQILVVISIITAALLIVNIRFKGWRLPFVAAGIWVAAAILIGSVYPALIQQYRVGPNELQAEKPYLQLNIQATNRAFGLDKVRRRDFPAATDLSARDLVENTPTINNVRLWDPTVLKTTYSQLQEIRLYYTFNDVDVDRYPIDDELREVMISPRELDVTQLSEQAQTWVNQHVVYTHGFGAVVSPVNRVTSDGLPSFIIKDIPPESSANLRIAQPRIYYGEEPDNYVLVHTGRNEFDYPRGATNQFTEYTGKGGIPLSNTLRKAAFAVEFGSFQLFLSPYSKPTARMMFRRNVQERLSQIAPFLMYDRDPYCAIVDGRLVFIQDAYTMSNKYPYSQRADAGFNYIRNSVKATVDAYDGTVRLYLVDPADPVARTYARIFPGLFTRNDEVPDSLRAHFRYPEDLFLTQAEIYRTYHMRNAEVFYNREDLWAIPSLGTSTGQEQMRPYYVLMRLPGSAREEFILFIPFTPNGKNNMIAWLSASSDPGDYGRLDTFDFPKQRLTFGPAQVDARINQDPEISRQITLWNQSGSRVIRGNLLVIPIKDAILYVQPLYLQATNSALPQLERVIVAFSDRIVMEPTFAEALARVFGEAAPEAERPPAGRPAAPTPPVQTIRSLVEEANRHFTAADEAARRGDWATYGREIRALRETLNRLSQQSGASTSAP